MLLYNAFTKRVGYVKYLPTLLQTSRSGQVNLPVGGGGGAYSFGITPRDPTLPVASGYVTPWPRDQHGRYEHNLHPDLKYLATTRPEWGIRLAVCGIKDTGKDRGDARLLAKFDCDAGMYIILLEEIH